MRGAWGRICYYDITICVQSIIRIDHLRNKLNFDLDEHYITA
jgi:hypothetical protein